MAGSLTSAWTNPAASRDRRQRGRFMERLEMARRIEDVSARLARGISSFQRSLHRLLDPLFHSSPSCPNETLRFVFVFSIGEISQASKEHHRIGGGEFL